MPLLPVPEVLIQAQRPGSVSPFLHRSVRRRPAARAQPAASLPIMEYRTTVVLGGKTATGLQVPDDVVEALGGGKRPPVVVTVAGHTYRTTVAPMGGAFWVPLSAEHREAAGLQARSEEHT